MWTSVFVSMIFGWILLLAVTFAIPDTQGALGRNDLALVVPWIWTESMSQNWAEFCCSSASSRSSSASRRR